MTTATCFNCGEIKFGAFVICPHCNKLPFSDDELILSLAMTDHYFQNDVLIQMGKSIKDGHPPHLDETTRENLLNDLKKIRNSDFSHLIEGGKKMTKKKWWQL